MTKYKPLADMVEPSVKDFRDVADKVKVSFQQRMPSEYKSGMYSGEYEKAKAAGTAAPRGVSQISTSRKPDLTLTGNMLKEITATSTGTSAKLEWAGSNAAKIQGLDRGKFPMFVGDEPASKKVNKDIEKAVNSLYDKRVKEQSQKVVFKL